MTASTSQSGGGNKFYGNTTIGCQPLPQWDSKLAGANVSFKLWAPFLSGSREPLANSQGGLQPFATTTLPLVPLPADLPADYDPSKQPRQGSWFQSGVTLLEVQSSNTVLNPTELDVSAGFGKPEWAPHVVHAVLTCRSAQGNAIPSHWREDGNLFSSTVWSLEIGDGSDNGHSGLKYITQPHGDDPLRGLVTVSTELPVVEGTWDEYVWVPPKPQLRITGACPTCVSYTAPGTGLWKKSGRQALVELTVTPADPTKPQVVTKAQVAMAAGAGAGGIVIDAASGVQQGTPFGLQWYNSQCPDGCS